LLWDPETLHELIVPEKVLSMRELFELAECWPDILPAEDGNAVVVAGLEGSLDVLDSEDAARWLETDLREVVLKFQDYYEGQAGLILWVPSGRSRITMRGASEEYYWKHSGPGASQLHIGRLLFSGAENEVERILNADDTHVDCDGKHWVGLHHPRIS
jgi:hypothetical protein